ncbi:MAG: hypothetical protein ISR65_09275 [Bacteriovoracaceae bacterium]|nr:hypothetical protein [Bacteriovoracaceae bacterium]
MFKGNLLKIFWLFIFLTFAPVTNAGFLLEPFFGYAIGTIDTNYEVPSTTETLRYPLNGVLFGGRVGATFLGLQAGIEYGVASLGTELNSSVTGSFDLLGNADSSYLGVFAGYQFPMLLKIWGTYYTNISYTFGADGAFSGKEAVGSGYGVGIGFQPIPIPAPYVSLSFNLEYRTFTMDKADLLAAKFNEGTGGGIFTSQDWTITEIYGSISFPVNF